MVALNTALQNISGDTIIANSIMITADGGIAYKLKNKTGAASVKGTIVMGNPTVLANSCKLATLDAVSPVGVMYSAGVADGGDVWVVTAGKAYILTANAATASGYMRTCWTGDTNAEAGKGYWEQAPVKPSATDKHFSEIGHNLETTAGAGLVLCEIHKN